MESIRYTELHQQQYGVFSLNALCCTINVCPNFSTDICIYIYIYFSHFFPAIFLCDSLLNINCRFVSLFHHLITSGSHLFSVFHFISANIYLPFSLHSHCKLAFNHFSFPVLYGHRIFRSKIVFCYIV